MTSANQQRPAPQWMVACSVYDLCVNSGMAVVVGGQHIALFSVPDENPGVYALGNYDPRSRANVLSRGIVGDVKGRLAVTSPRYKQHFELRTGICLEDETNSVPVYPVSVEAGSVWVAVQRPIA